MNQLKTNAHFAMKIVRISNGNAKKNLAIDIKFVVIVSNLSAHKPSISNKFIP